MVRFDWGDLKFFLAIARTGRLTAAARVLRVDHATVSRRLRALEFALDAKLFEHHPQGYRLTAAGERLLAAAEVMETTALQVESALSGTDAALTGTVRIGAPDGFGTWFLARRLGALLVRHPHLTVQLVPLPRVFSLAKREADIVVTIDPPDASRTDVRRLTDYTLSFYGSRDYLAAHPTIATTADLRDHRVVGYVPDLLFTDTLAYLGDFGVPEGLRFECASVIGQIEAVRAGLGVGVLHDFVAQADPSLVRVLPQTITRTYWIVADVDVLKIARVREVFEFVVDAVAAERFVYG
ncbi:LysR family transcriptional regulator [Rhodoplanes serenus]|uniref:LysR family transcriptional regulator n=1 Tax=Rhodoplanes serenus TaxID=200615 RepID=A0A9X4XMK0_9BRAD|nr:LysR family transcriptional regulator [Rhodoplanes serenus]MTW16274.1 LysR family transcriptional regulator [Rhodoplanes serenus]